MNKFLKLILEMGPLLIFFYLNSMKHTMTFGDMSFKPIIVATAGFMIATLISLIVMYVLMRKLPMMPLVSGVFVVILGGMTIYLNDETFIKIKPTIVNIFFSAALFIGLYYKRLFLKMILEDGFELTDQGWHIMTKRWGWFFLFLALVNEIVWRNFSTDFWVSFKTFGIMPMTIIFVIFQLKFILAHSNSVK